MSIKIFKILMLLTICTVCSGDEIDEVNSLDLFHNKYQRYLLEYPDDYDIDFLINEWEISNSKIVNDEIIKIIKTKEEYHSYLYNIASGVITWGVNKNKYSKLKKMLKELNHEKRFIIDDISFPESQISNYVIPRYDIETAPLGVALAVGKFSVIVTIDYLSDLKDADALYNYICKPDGILLKLLCYFQNNADLIRNVDVNYWFDLAISKKRETLGLFVMDKSISKYRLMYKTSLLDNDVQNVKLLKNALDTFLPSGKNIATSLNIEMYKYNGKKRRTIATDCIFYGSWPSLYNWDGANVYFLKHNEYSGDSIRLNKNNIYKYFKNIE